MTSSIRILAALIPACILSASGASAAQDDAARISTYPAAYFTSMQPYSAFDMLTATPGFTFVDSDPEVRGFGGAVGNVLIDGVRPAAKKESLEATLRRIPASAVERIELIRSGVAGADMQGHTVLANVVRAREASVAGAMELASTFYDGFTAPRTSAEWTHEAERRRVELSGSVYRQTGDEHGDGALRRTGEDGDLISDARYLQDYRERIFELAGVLEQRLAGGTLRANGSFARERSRTDASEAQIFPDDELESDLEQERQSDAELGVHYDVALASGQHWEWLGLYRRTTEDEREDSVEPTERSSFVQRNTGSEAILRGRVRGALGRAAMEAGVEGARNVLEGRSALEEDGVAVALPAANVRVEERRVEAFALSTFRLDAEWALEAGARFEYSVLEQSGDTRLRKSFFFPKPRVLLSHAPADAAQWRLLVERRVGQLDFEDFVTSTSLSVDTVSAGNPDLEPESAWMAELAWERQWLKDASLLVAVRREWISDVVDLRPVVAGATLLDGVGNIGDGVRDELQIDLSLPLSALGLDSARVKLTSLWRSGETTDPTTAERRPISGDLAFEGAVSFTHDLPALNIHWGVEVELGREAKQFMIDEVRVESVATQIDFFVEYAPTPAWNVRFAANNLTDRALERERGLYDGPRGEVPLEYREVRRLYMEPYYSLSVRRSFGR